MHVVRIEMMVSKRKTSKPHSEWNGDRSQVAELISLKVLPNLVVCSFPGILTNLSWTGRCIQCSISTSTMLRCGCTN